MQITNGAVLLQPGEDYAARIRAAIPRTAQGMVNGQLTLAVKHKLGQTLVLRNLGFDIPSPIAYGWKYPGMYVPRDNQRHTSAFMTLHKRAFIFNEMRCVDANTEYLSPTGWRRIADYDGGMVAQYDKDTEQANFVQPTEYIKKECIGPMIRFKTVKGVDQLLTPNHRVLYVGSTGKKAVISAEEIEFRNEYTELGWSGQFITTFNMQPQTELALSELELRLMVAVIADGHFQSNSSRCVVRLKKQRKIDRLNGLLIKSGIEFDVREDMSITGHGFFVFTFNAPKRDKDFKNYWSASKEQLYIIADEVQHWDSALGKKERVGTFRFSSYIKESADFIQYVCSSTGNTCSLRTYSRDRGRGLEVEHVVFVRRKASLLYLKATTSDGEKINNVSREPSPDGYCYCFSVPKTFLVMRRNGCVFITGNTGKTMSALWGAEYLLQEGFIRRVLIVCPKSCMHDVWANALFECLPHRSSIILHGDRNKRLDNLAKDTEFCIINHDGITALSKEVVKGKSSKMVCEELLNQFDLIIYDEADVLCNHRTKLYKAFESLIQPETWLWLMTGTPTPNQYADAWGLLKLVVREVVYRNQRINSWTKFRELVMYRINQYKWGNRYGSKDILFELMQPAIRFTKAQCFDAKEVKPEYRTSEMTAEQKKAYWQMQKDGKVHRGEDDPAVVAKNAAIKLAKLLQISMGAVKDEYDQKVSFDSKYRLNTLREVLHEAGVKPYDAPNEEASKKSIVFMPYKYTMEDVHTHLTEKGYRCTIVNGDVGEAQRRQRFKGFKGVGAESLYEVLIAHPEVTAHGLDLTVAESIIWYAPCYGNRLYAQGNERIQGAVQKGDPVIFEIVCTKLEKERFETLKKGSLTQAELLSMYERALEEEI